MPMEFRWKRSLEKVGGKEDDLEAEADRNTDPEEAKRICGKNGCFFSGDRDRYSSWILCGNSSVG